MRKSDSNCSVSDDNETFAPHESTPFYLYEESECNVVDGDGSLVRWFSDNSLNSRHCPVGDPLSPNVAPNVGRGAVVLEPRDLLKRKLKTHVSMVNLTTSSAVGHQHQETVVVDVVAENVPSVQRRLYRQSDSRPLAEGLPQGYHQRKAFGGSSEAIMYLSQSEMDQSLNRIFGEPKYGGDIRRRTSSHGNDSYYARRRNRSYRPNSLNVFSYAVRISERRDVVKCNALVCALFSTALTLRKGMRKRVFGYFSLSTLDSLRV